MRHSFFYPSIIIVHLNNTAKIGADHILHKSMVDSPTEAQLEIGGSFDVLKGLSAERELKRSTKLAVARSPMYADIFNPARR